MLGIMEIDNFSWIDGLLVCKTNIKNIQYIKIKLNYHSHTYYTYLIINFRKQRFDFSHYDHHYYTTNL